jgi:hypothetical protein
MHLTLKSLLVFLLLAGFVVFCEPAQAKPQAEEGLEVYYDFETEDAQDQSGNGRDGAVSGKPKLIDGAVGKAWEFDGGTVIDMDFPIMTAADPELSIRCFILPEEVVGQHVIYDEGGAWTGFCVRIMDGELQFATVCCDENHPPPVIIAAELPDTEDWIEIAAVFGQGKMILYMNGEKLGEEKTEWQQLGGHGQAGGIGQMSPGDTAFGGAGNFFVGGIDEFRVYSRILRPEEVRAAVSSRDKLAATWGGLRIGL